VIDQADLMAILEQAVGSGHADHAGAHTQICMVFR
jgi:hypothetical protein